MYNMRHENFQDPLPNEAGSDYRANPPKYLSVEFAREMFNVPEKGTRWDVRPGPQTEVNDPPPGFEALNKLCIADYFINKNFETNEYLRHIPSHVVRQGTTNDWEEYAKDFQLACSNAHAEFNRRMTAFVL
jgi:hypothetical protein